LPSTQPYASCTTSVKTDKRGKAGKEEIERDICNREEFKSY